PDIKENAMALRDRPIVKSFGSYNLEQRIAFCACLTQTMKQRMLKAGWLDNHFLPPEQFRISGSPKFLRDKMPQSPKRLVCFGVFCAEDDLRRVSGNLIFHQLTCSNAGGPSTPPTAKPKDSEEIRKG